MASWAHLIVTACAIIQLFGFSESIPRRDSKISGVWRKNHRKRQIDLGGFISSQSTAGGQAISFPTAQPQHPRVQCTKAGFFPSPGSCLKFHRCVDFSGKGLWFSVFHFDCPAGTIFDPSLSICNHVWAVTGRPECNGIVVSPTILPTQQTVTPLRPIEQTVTTSRPIEQTVTTSRPIQQTVTPSRPIEQTVTTSPPTQQTATPSSPIEQTPRPIKFPVTSSQTIEPVTPESPTEIPPSIWTLPPSGELNATSPPDNSVPVICFRDKVYRIHPQYCNMYYYCEEAELKVFSCPAGLVFDRTDRTCSRDVECDTKIAPLAVKPIEIGESLVTSYPSTESQTETTITMRPLTVGPTEVETAHPPTTQFVTDYITTALSVTEETTTEKVWETAPGSIYDCGSPGYYPFEGDCIRFYKCVVTDNGKLQGLLYRCPPKFGYSENDKRCVRLELLPTCQRVPQDAHVKLGIQNATPLYPHDLNWFFNSF